MSKVGDPPSKYAYSPDRLDTDIRNKMDVGNTAMEDAKQMIDKFMHNPYKYHDGVPMSTHDRWATLIRVLREAKETLGL